MKVLTLGTFDTIHPGHVGLFRKCHQLAGPGGHVAVAVNTDDFVAKFKRKPTMTVGERMHLVKAIRYVDSVVMNDGTDQAALILKEKPCAIVIGSDWARKDYLAQLGIDQDFLDKHNIALCYVPRSGDWSSTEIRARLTTTPPPLKWLPPRVAGADQ